MQYAKTVSFIDTGLAAVGYTLYDIDGSEYQARTTTNVTELGSTGVYFVKLSIPDEFNGVLVWDDGQSDPIYSSEDLAGHQNTKLGQITDGIDVMLQSIAMHRVAVEPIIDKLSIGDIKDSFKTEVNGVKEAIKSLKESAKQTTKEINKGVTEQMRALNSTESQKMASAVKKIEQLYFNYQSVIKDVKELSEMRGTGLKKDIKTLGDKVDGVSGSVKRVIDSELAGAVSEYIQKSQTVISGNLSKDLDRGIKDVGNKVSNKSDIDQERVRKVVEDSMVKMEKQMMQYLTQMLTLVNAGINKPGVNKLSFLRSKQ